MRNSVALFIGICAIGLLVLACNKIYFSNFNGLNAVKQDQYKIGGDKSSKPNELYLEAKNYPDTISNEQAYREAMKEMHRDYTENKTSARTLSWTSYGPTNIGGRITSMAVNPQNQQIIYAGTPNGGIFKTVNSGATWNPIFDDQPFLAIGDICIDPNNPQVVYAGTGDRVISGYPFTGNGVYKTNNSGNTWTNIGLQDKGIVSNIYVSPTNSNLLYVSTMGSPFERDLHRGLYKSINGGTSWEELLQLGDQTGVIDFVVHPTIPSIIYAAGWDRIRTNNESTVTGIGGKVYKTVDGGDSWEMLDNGLPQDTVSRIGLVIHPTTPSIIYAVYVGSDLELMNIYKTTDGGASWLPLPLDNLYEQSPSPLAGFGWYFGQLRLNPYNPNDLYLLGVHLWRTSDDGLTWDRVEPLAGNSTVHADKHDMYFYTAESFILATDGGIYKTNDNGESWIDLEYIPNTQLYRVAINPHQANDYWAGAQDNGTIRLNSAVTGFWDRKRGGDGFTVDFHPNVAGVVYSSTQNGMIGYATDYFDGFYTNMLLGIDGDDRRNWDTPYFISSHFPYSAYTGTYRVYKKNNPTIMDSTDLWMAISEDLTDGLIYEERFHNITAMCESPLMKGLLYIGTTDANVWVSENDGANWNNITDGLPERYITDIKASSTDINTVFVSTSGYRDNDNTPHIYKSINGGQDWVSISGDLPNAAINHLEVYNGYNHQIIFAATDGGVYYTVNGGTQWDRLGDNMPVCAVYDLEIDYENNYLLAGTFARSLMVTDLTTILEQFTGIISPDKPLLTDVSVYYNQGNKSIDVNYKGIEKGEIMITNLSGQLFYKRSLSSGQQNITLSSHPMGLYLVSIHTASGYYNQKIVKY